MSFLAQTWMAPGKYAAMNAVQAPTPETVLTALAVDANAFELRKRDRSVLTGGDGRGEGVRLAVEGFCIHGDA
jgi:hypothetical protein